MSGQLIPFPAERRRLGTVAQQGEDRCPLRAIDPLGGTPCARGPAIADDRWPPRLPAFRSRCMDAREVRMIRKRSGGYGVAVYDRVTKSKRWVGTFPTLREARDAERDAAALPAGRSNQTCDRFAERWLADNARPAPATQRTYRYALRRFIADFKGIRLRDLDKPLPVRGLARIRNRTSA